MVVQKSWISCFNYWLWSQISLCGLHCSPVCFDPFIIVFLLRKAVFRGNHVFSDAPYLKGWMFQSCRFRRYQKVIDTGSLSPTPNAQCEWNRDFGLSRVCNCQNPRFSGTWVIGAFPSPPHQEGDVDVKLNNLNPGITDSYTSIEYTAVVHRIIIFSIVF